MTYGMCNISQRGVGLWKPYKKGYPWESSIVKRGLEIENKRALGVFLASFQ